MKETFHTYFPSYLALASSMRELLHHKAVKRGDQSMECISNGALFSLTMIQVQGIILITNSIFNIQILNLYRKIIEKQWTSSTDSTNQTRQINYQASTSQRFIKNPYLTTLHHSQHFLRMELSLTTMEKQTSRDITRMGTSSDSVQ